MFGIGWAELVVIGIVALLVVGPEKLPEAARAAGRIYGYIYRTLTEARASIKAEVDLATLDSRKPRTMTDETAEEAPETDQDRELKPPQENL